MLKRFVPFTLIAILIGVIFTLSFHGDMSLWTSKTPKHWIQSSAKMGMVIVDDEGLLESDLGKLFLFQFGRNKKISRLVRGVKDGHLYFCFDYSSDKRQWSKTGYPQSATAIAFPLKESSLPFFWLKSGKRETWYRNIPFSDYAEFSKNYLVSGPNEGSIKQLFSPEVRKAFIALKKSSKLPQSLLSRLHVDGGKKWLVVYVADNYLDSEQLVPFVQMAAKIKTELLGHK